MTGPPKNITIKPRNWRGIWKTIGFYFRKFVGWVSRCLKLQSFFFKQLGGSWSRHHISNIPSFGGRNLTKLELSLWQICKVFCLWPVNLSIILVSRLWFQRFFIFTPIPGEMIQFDASYIYIIYIYISYIYIYIYQYTYIYIYQKGWNLKLPTSFGWCFLGCGMVTLW